jgi:hypothetical protein
MFKVERGYIYDMRNKQRCIIDCDVWWKPLHDDALFARLREHNCCVVVPTEELRQDYLRNGSPKDMVLLEREIQ